MSRCIVGNSIVLLKLQGVSAWWKKTAQTRVLVLPLPSCWNTANLNQVTINYHSQSALLRTLTVLWDNLCWKSQELNENPHCGQGYYNKTTNVQLLLWWALYMYFVIRTKHGAPSAKSRIKLCATPSLTSDPPSSNTSLMVRIYHALSGAYLRAVSRMHSLLTEYRNNKRVGVPPCAFLEYPSPVRCWFVRTAKPVPCGTMLSGHPRRSVFKIPKIASFNYYYFDPY